MRIVLKSLTCSSQQSCRMAVKIRFWWDTSATGIFCTKSHSQRDILGVWFTKYLTICPKIITRSITSQLKVRQVVILYDLSYNCHLNAVLQWLRSVSDLGRSRSNRAKCSTFSINIWLLQHIWENLWLGHVQINRPIYIWKRMQQIVKINLAVKLNNALDYRANRLTD